MNFILLILINLLNILLVKSAKDPFNCDIEPKNLENRIKKKILCDYDKESPPPSFTTFKEDNVIVEISPRSVDVYSNPSGIYLKSNTLVHYTDERLMWDAGNFEGRASVLVDSSDVWIPSLKQFDSTMRKEEFVPVYCSDTKCDILSEGSVTCIIPCRYYGSCDLEFSNWPYIYGNCSVSLRKTDDIHEEVSYLASVPQNIDLLTKNLEYELVSVNCSPIYDIKGDKNKNYNKYEYNMIRHAISEAAIILSPILINQFINILVLFIDVRNGERLSLLVICMLMLQYMDRFLGIARNWNFEEDFPKIGNLLLKTNHLSALTVFATIIIKSMMAVTYGVPHWMEIFLNKITNNPKAELCLIKSYIMPMAEKKLEAIEIHPGVNKNLKKSEQWVTIAKIIDRLFAMVIIILYLIVWIKFVPSSKMAQEFRNKIQSS